MEPFTPIQKQGVKKQTNENKLAQFQHSLLQQNPSINFAQACSNI